MRCFHKNIFSQRGMTLIELMVALAIGSVLLIGLATVFFNSSRTHRELEKSGQMIENGRYSINLLYDDLRHAGFYGYTFDLPAAPTSPPLPDPCEATDLSILGTGMTLPIQGYKAASASARPDITTTTCGSGGTDLLVDDNLSPGSDILVMRRADTLVFSGVIDNLDNTTAAALTDPTNYEVGAVYLQANPQAYELMIGVSGANPPTTKADNTAPTMLKYPTSATHTEAADTRKYHVHVYFVAPCSTGTGSPDGVCQSSDPRLPTLKRLELSADSGGVTQMSIVPLVEGIEYFKVDYGIDTTPATVDPITGFAGDGVPDTYVTAPSSAQWPNVVTIRINMLARNIKATNDYTDDKAYTIAGASFGPFMDHYKRHVFSTEVRPMNVGGRREIPK